MCCFVWIFILIFSLDMFPASDSICKDQPLFFLICEVVRTWPSTWVNRFEFEFFEFEFL